MANEKNWAIMSAEPGEDIMRRMSNWMTESEAIDWLRNRAKNIPETASYILGRHCLTTVHSDGTVVTYEAQLA